MKTVPMPLEQCEECAPEGLSLESAEGAMAIADESLQAGPAHIYLQNFAVHYEYSVGFTRDLFLPSNRSHASSRIAVTRSWFSSMKAWPRGRTSIRALRLMQRFTSMPWSSSPAGIRPRGASDARMTSLLSSACSAAS
jgi:hypothetical protein